MSTSLYDMSIASSLQILGGVSRVLDKGRAHCEENGIDLDEIVKATLAEDMLGFHFQVVSCVHHSLGSIKGIRAGEFRPPAGYPDTDYAGLQQLVASAIDELTALTVDEVNGYAGSSVIFKLAEKQIPFTAENFVLSFSHPNLYFHAATTYSLLRMRGAPLGKRDFMGRLRYGLPT